MATATAPRHSKREAKQKRAPVFAHDEDSLAFLASRSSNEGGSTLRHSSSNIINEKGENCVINSDICVNAELNSWRDIVFLNSYLPSYAHVDSEITPVNDIVTDKLVESSRSPIQEQNSASDNSDSCFGKISAAGRNYSSTRLDFLDIYSITSVSPTPRIDTSDMSDKNADCECSEGVTCAKCTTVGAEGGDDGDLLSSLNEALRKINLLTSEVSYLRKDVDKLKSGNESSASHSSKHSKISLKDKDKVKKHRVEIEKERHLKLMKEKLKSRRGVDSSSSDDSEGDLNMKTLRKKMSRKKKEECEAKLGYKLKMAGASFDDDSSSGTDSTSSERKHRLRYKVKSGAKMRKRPVIRTELWPHIIANEDDGDEVTSEDIGLAKFFSCFTFIMTNCGRKEAAGRAELLHAVSNILECLPWADARTFHNLVMVKLEQGRLTWSSEFSSLALDFLDKKTRLNLRSKSAAGYGLSSKSNSKNSGKSYYKSGRSNFNFSNNSNKSKSLYAMFCNQWNFGTCGYGERCRKWHVCWTCAEAGKPGEPHKASSHSSSTGYKQGDSRP